MVKIVGEYFPANRLIASGLVVQDLILQKLFLTESQYVCSRAALCSRLHDWQELRGSISSATWQIQPMCQRKKSYCCLKRAFLHPRQKPGEFSPLQPPLCTSMQCMLDWKINQVMDYSNSVFASGKISTLRVRKWSMQIETWAEDRWDCKTWAIWKPRFKKKTSWRAAWGNLSGSSCSYQTVENQYGERLIRWRPNIGEAKITNTINCWQE